jgi:hypothetical protein
MVTSSVHVSRANFCPLRSQQLHPPHRRCSWQRLIRSVGRPIAIHATMSVYGSERLSGCQALPHSDARMRRVLTLPSTARHGTSNLRSIEDTSGRLFILVQSSLLCRLEYTGQNNSSQNFTSPHTLRCILRQSSIHSQICNADPTAISLALALL